MHDLDVWRAAFTGFAISFSIMMSALALLIMDKK